MVLRGVYHLRFKGEWVKTREEAWQGGKVSDPPPPPDSGKHRVRRSQPNVCVASQHLTYVQPVVTNATGTSEAGPNW